jgi:hypothetical protein
MSVLSPYELFNGRLLALYGWEVGSLDHFQYLLLMAACLLITLLLESVLGARV